ncbi:uncharacterized protein LOC122329772 [Puntigrus tetrazona]|uniref:uncharacterized protein LOC122329772 n=1 Tax=Puntigrus tetrazona TaxID=1606681 RepID=UPI001C892982|nr:uncharacterized protein LOC122329772 [Puntigrus tetrazona]XP_043082274.1 uncharacterized protein LOC122329772 [Puntigrus tetrazona]
MNMQQTAFEAAETTGPSSSSTSHEEDASLSCRIANQGFSVPCMSSSDVEACIEMLKRHPGPLLYRNGEIFRRRDITDWNGLRLTREPLCLMKVKGEKSIKSCYGVYLRNDFILTAFHTFQYSSLYDAYVFFPTTDFVLVYEANLPKKRHMFHDKDQCLVKLLGQTDVLGKGLLDRCASGESEGLYFYAFDVRGNLQKHTCTDITRSLNKKSQIKAFVMSTAGQPGESGNPVFCLRSNQCVGIYTGITKSKKGHASVIDVKQLFKHTAPLNANPSFLKKLYGFLSNIIRKIRCLPSLSTQTSDDDSD